MTMVANEGPSWIHSFVISGVALTSRQIETSSGGQGSR